MRAIFTLDYVMFLLIRQSYSKLAILKNYNMYSVLSRNVKHPILSRYLQSDESLATTSILNLHSLCLYISFHSKLKSLIHDLPKP